KIVNISLCGLPPVVIAGGGLVRTIAVIHRLIRKICNLSVDESHKGRRRSCSAFFPRPPGGAGGYTCHPLPVCRVRSVTGRALFHSVFSPSLYRGAPFKPLSRHSLAVGKTDGCGIPRSALTRYRTRRTGSVRQGTVSR
ncbi:TPA: hypothetical protein ACWV6Y_006003, partial [Salmonella enterica subsp. enterica serovar Muenchen]